MASVTLLCIDDKPRLLELGKPTLESYGYSVEIVSSGAAAVEMLRKAPVAAVLLEYQLEGINSETIACNIKERFPKLPIIMPSASEIPERILWLLDDYVMKSELPEGLSRIIQRTSGFTKAGEAHKAA